MIMAASLLNFIMFIGTDSYSSQYNQSLRYLIFSSQLIFTRDWKQFFKVSILR